MTLFRKNKLLKRKRRIKMKPNNDGKTDLVVQFDRRGLHHVLERIVLILPPRSVLACTKVSPEWNRIVLHHHDSTNPKIQTLQESRSVQWNGIALKPLNGITLEWAENINRIIALTIYRDQLQWDLRNLITINGW
jgi:hypothetical protein